MILLATLLTVLYRYTDQEDIVVGTSISGRTRPETERLIGCFFNQLALRTNLSGNPTFRELLGRVREVTLDAYANQDLPFEKLLEDLQPERDSSRFPLFQLFFSVGHDSAENIEMPGLTLSVLEVPYGVAKFDLILMIKSGAQGLSGVLQYNTNLFKASTIRRMLDHFQIVLEDVLQYPDKELRSIAVTAKGETDHLVHSFNDDLKG
jgi:non-ribosomal peptide synthetase component F